MTYKKSYILLILLFILTLPGCKGCKSPPTSLEPPDTEIIYPADGDTITNALVRFEWKGLDNATAYQYRLDNEDWSTWVTETSDEIFLDEETHTFTVKSRNKLKREDPSPASVVFYVNAITGPALWIKKRQKKAEVNNPCSLKVWAEDVTNLMLANIELMYDNSKLKIVNVIKDTTFLTKNGGEIQLISDFNDTFPIAKVNIGLVGGTPKGVSGSGPLFTLDFLLKVSDSTEVSFSTSTEIRDTLNNKIQLTGMWSSTIIPLE